MPAASSAPMDSPAAVRMTTGRVRKYSAAYFISVGRIFLPMYSGVRPTIRPGDEHGDDGQHQDAVQARADAAGRDLAERDVEQRDAAAERR